MSRALFELGATVATPAVLESLHLSGESAGDFLRRHVQLERGDLDDHDHAANARALRDGSRILSAYTTARGVRIWIVTEAVGDDGRRASTCLLLPEEY